MHCFSEKHSRRHFRFYPEEGLSDFNTFLYECCRHKKNAGRQMTEKFFETQCTSLLRDRICSSPCSRRTVKVAVVPGLLGNRFDDPAGSLSSRPGRRHRGLDIGNPGSRFERPLSSRPGRRQTGLDIRNDGRPTC